MISSKSMMTCVLSAMIVASCGATTVFAEDTSTIIQDNSQIVTQQSWVSQETNDVQTTGQLDISTETSNQEQLQQEQSQVEQSQLEQSSQEQFVPEQSQPEVVYAPVLDGEQTVYFCINFGGAFVRASTCLERGYIDLSNVKVSILTADKSATLKAFKISDDLLSSYVKCGDTIPIAITLPEYKEGSSYILHFENLPSIYGDSVQDYELRYTESVDNEVEIHGGVPTTTKIVHTIRGLSDDDSLVVSLRPTDFNIMMFMYDLSGNIAPSAKLKVTGYSSTGKVLISSIVETNSDGIATLSILDDEVVSIGVRLENSVNGEVMGGEVAYDFNSLGYSNGSPLICKLSTTSKYSQSVTDDNGNPVSTSINVPFKYTLKDKWDMSVFDDIPCRVGVYNGTTLLTSLSFDNDSKENSLSLAKGSKYGLSTLSNDYSVSYSTKTLTVKDGVSITLTAEPKLSLKVINEKDGKQQKANFKINGKAYNNANATTFAVNGGVTYSVTNTDTAETFYVLIGDYTETVLNIATGSVNQNGYIGNGTDNSNKPSNETNGVPNTGDIFLYIIGGLLGVTLICGSGYWYFKRKGIKNSDEK